MIEIAAQADLAAPASSATPLTRVIDRWIWVFMAASFVAYALIGFIPTSLAKVAAVEAGQRPPLPLVLHFHAVLMGSFLMLLLAQTSLAATGRLAYHRHLGLAAVVLGPAIVIAGFILIPTTYAWNWNAIQALPPEAQAGPLEGLRVADNIMLMQIRVGLLFPLFLTIAMLARKTDPGLHKRMMFLSIAFAMPAAFDRIAWIPSTLPGSPVSPDLYVLFAISPMFIWDVVRTRTVHKAYLIFLAAALPAAIAVHGLWDTEWWHTTARGLVGL